jgi:large conductance mechanosensitive channel
MNLLKDFRDFILRGNVLDLAIAVIIGAAFGAIITALVKDILTPIIGIFGKFSFPDLTLTVRGSKFLIGDFINTVISFLIIALVLFFLVVRPLARFNKATRKCPHCKSSISSDATRCAYCTSTLTDA